MSTLRLRARQGHYSMEADVVGTEIYEHGANEGGDGVDEVGVVLTEQ